MYAYTITSAPYIYGNLVTHKTNAFQVDFEWGWGYVILSDRQTVKAIFHIKNKDFFHKLTYFTHFNFQYYLT